MRLDMIFRQIVVHFISPNLVYIQTVSIWKKIQNNWLFFMFAMISYSSEIYEGVAKIIRLRLIYFEVLSII